MPQSYVHGYAEREGIRLQDQAATLVELLHADTVYPAGARILEVGCGVGAQTLTLARRSPEALITAIDLSADSLAKAGAAVRAAGIGNVSFQQADLWALPFAPGSFDHLFVCFVLEHLSNPLAALVQLKGMLAPGGTITAIEGDHGSAYFYPESPAADKAIQCQVELQRRAGGNARVGRALHPLLTEAGFGEVHVSPRMVYADASRPGLQEGFTRKTFTAMIEGIQEAAIQAGLIERDEMEQGIAGLYRAAAQDGVFCYTFFKATAVKARKERP